MAKETKPSPITKSARIKLRDKRQNKLKTAIELVIVAHEGSFKDVQERRGSGIKSTYERVIEGKTLRFNYNWHQTPSDRRTLKNTRSRMHANLQKLDIVERLPSLMVRSAATYDTDMLAIRKQSKTGRAFIALENAFLALEENLE